MHLKKNSNTYFNQGSTVILIGWLAFLNCNAIKEHEVEVFSIDTIRFIGCNYDIYLD